MKLIPTKHSVIIAAYDAANYIEQSVSSALTQLGPKDQVVVVDDGSADDTRDIVSGFADARLTMLCQPCNLGIASARNRALEVIQGDYVHFLDHDDLWPDDRLALIAAAIDRSDTHTHPDIVSGWVEHFYCPTLSALECARYVLPPTQAAALPGSVIMSRRLLERVGRFNVGLSSGEFVDYLSRALMFQPSWVKLDRVLFQRRIHGRNHTLTDHGVGMAYLAVIREHMRRRQSPSMDMSERLGEEDGA